MKKRSFFSSLSHSWAELQRWGMHKYALGPKNYWFTFFADSSTALFCLFWAFRSGGGNPFSIVIATVVGYLIWTLTEYIFHRWIYHQPEGIFGEGHRIHHDEDQVLVAMPWFMTTLSMFGLWYVFSVKLHFPLFSACLAGWLAGFVWYSIVHHSHHHWNIENSWMRKLKAYHRIHHQLPECNFGVTMRFWDSVFGTRHRRPPAQHS